MRTVVLGGSGFIGRSIVEKLVTRSGGGSGTIVVPTRRPARVKHLQLLPTVLVTPANVHDEAELTRLVAGADAVINLVAILQGSEADFRRVHVELPAKLTRACKSAGVARLVHVSALGAALNAPSRYLRSKAEGEQAIRQVWPAATVLRPSVVFGEHDKLLNLFASLQRVAPFVPLAGADAKLQPVWVEDVAEAAIRCLEEPSSSGRIYELAGPAVLTLRQLVQLAGRWSGHPRPVFALPGPIAHAQALLFEALPGEPLISRDNLASLRVPNVAGGAMPGLAALGITPTPLEAIAPSYLGTTDEARLDSWRARARRS